jgi:Family of unknown function (DUF6350)/zinc-ribbon domain
MECPACGAAISDKEAKFCPRCGVALDSTEFEVTDTIKVEDGVEGEKVDAGGTTEIVAESAASESEDTNETPPPEETTDLRARLTRAGWMEAVESAALAFLFMLCVAAVLVLAIRLQGVGGDADIIEILSSIVLFALGILGIPIRLGRFAISIVPLGALLVVGAGIVWAVRLSLMKRDAIGSRDRVMSGVKTGLCLGVLCFLAALVFGISGRVPVSANPWVALVFGAAWGALFGALGGWSLPRSPWQSVRSLFDERTEGSTRGGMLAGMLALGICAVLAVVVLLLWIIGALIQGPPRALGAGDAFAGILYLVAFLPNIVVAIVCLSLGAPVSVGAQISAGGRLVGPLNHYSIFGWAGGDAPWFIAILILIPAIGCFAAGMYAQSHSPSTSRTRTILIMGATFAIALFLLSLLGEARIGPGLLRARGFAKLSPQPWWTLLLAFAWAARVGYLGWRVSETRSRKPASMRES